ncbi:MAG: hypothetical protein U1E49_16650 [Hyphomicrobiaceae bacterium]
MGIGKHGKNGKLGYSFATYLLLASFVLVIGRYQGWYQVRPDYSVDLSVNTMFDRAYDASLVCPEQKGVRVVRISAATVEAARDIIGRDLPLCKIRSVTRHRSASI